MSWCCAGIRSQSLAVRRLKKWFCAAWMRARPSMRFVITSKSCLMGAKRSAEMKEALRLHAAGVNAHAAARKAGVLPSSFYRLLAERRMRDDVSVQENVHQWEPRIRPYKLLGDTDAAYDTSCIHT